MNKPAGHTVFLTTLGGLTVPGRESDAGRWKRILFNGSLGATIYRTAGEAQEAVLRTLRYSRAKRLGWKPNQYRVVGLYRPVVPGRPRP